MNHVRRFVPPALFILVPTVLVFPFLFQGRMLYGHDVVSVFHAQRIVVAEAFREGRLPVWDPTVMGGFPLMAGMQAAVFYPPTWLCLILSAGVFWTFTAWLHFMLAGFFAHRWLERGLGVGPWAALAGGFVYMMSGYIVGHTYAGHVNYVWAYPWMAALLWRLERYLAAPTLRRGVLLAVVFAMLFLAGVPQFVYFAGLLALARGVHFVLGERDGRRERAKPAGQAAAWLGLGLLLCAPQLLPTLELVAQMQRGTAEDRDFITEHSMAPSEALGLLRAPEKTKDLFWERCAYLGGAAVLLLAWGLIRPHRQRFLWLGLAIFGLMMAMGLHTPVYPGVSWVLPGASLFRGPGRYLLLLTLGATALAALGFQGLWDRGQLPFRILAGVLAAATAVQLSLFGMKLLEPVPLLTVESFPALQQVRDRAGLDGRISTTSAEDIGRCQAAGVDTVCGYEPMMLRRYAEVMNTAEGHRPERAFVLMASVGRHPLMDMLCVRGWLTYLRSYSRPSQTVTENPGALPRAWLVNNAVVIESKPERLRVLGKGPWDPRKTVVLEDYPAGPPPVPTERPAGTVHIKSRKAGEYVLEAENDADAFLVLSEAYYPGWRAEVDGSPGDVLPANHLIQAVRLPPGKHVVRFSYRSRFLGVGVAIALLAAFAPVAIELVRRRRR